MTKIAMIGAGSVVFVKNLLTDILSLPALNGCEIALHDIDPERLETAGMMARWTSTQFNAGARVTEHPDRRRCVEGADFVINMVQIGMHAATLLDFDIPRRYGLKQTIADTVGIGQYRIDLHPSTRGRNYVDIASWPFQIPLGSLIPVRVDNLLPAAKNLGVTHITNGCYRLHPVEWNIGEAAGALAAHALNTGTTPREVRNTPGQLADFQRLISSDLGFELDWPEAQRLTPSPGF